MLFKSTPFFVFLCLHSRLLVQQVLIIDLGKQTSEKKHPFQNVFSKRPRYTFFIQNGKENSFIWIRFNF